jgi:hypothetical protein
MARYRVCRTGRAAAVGGLCVGFHPALRDCVVVGEVRGVDAGAGQGEEVTLLLLMRLHVSKHLVLHVSGEGVVLC